MDNNVQVLSWLGNSPDLNPIENLWSRLKKLVSKKRPSNRTQLIEAVISSWHHTIQQEELKVLVESMPSRCLAVVKARGYPTKYKERETLISSAYSYALYGYMRRICVDVEF